MSTAKGPTAKGLILAAPHSGSGKTLITLGLLAALRRRGIDVAPAKTGPDYIDPAFHAAAAGRWGPNLDGWAMPPGQIGRRIARISADFIVCEGVMGLMDGAHVPASEDCDGSTRHLAEITGWPVVMVVDAGGMATSTVAPLAGFEKLLPQVRLAGVIFNKVGGEKHEAVIRQAMAKHLPHWPILGFVPPLAALKVPSRHLGLVQIAEHPDVAGFIAAASAHLSAHVDLEQLVGLAGPANTTASDHGRIAPLGQRIALAQDAAFAFHYADLIEDWRAQGTEIVPFSPLADQAPDPGADAVYLPGGYPELHADTLATGSMFLGGLKAAAARGATLFGECGGYMVLGDALIDGQGRRHAMAGLLPVVTSFERPKRHLGYRQARLLDDHPLGRRGTDFAAHEFHYANEIDRTGPALFRVSAANCLDLCDAGSVRGSVSGSFIHLISMR